MPEQEQSPLVLKTVEHGEASELPKAAWRWRRVYAFLVTAALLYLVWLVVGRTVDVGTLREIAQYSLILVGLVTFVYVAGATATDVVQLVSAVRTTRRETISETQA